MAKKRKKRILSKQERELILQELQQNAPQTAISSENRSKTKDAKEEVVQDKKKNEQIAPLKLKSEKLNLVEQNVAKKELLKISGVIVLVGVLFALIIVVDNKTDYLDTLGKIIADKAGL